MKVVDAFRKESFTDIVTSVSVEAVGENLSDAVTIEFDDGAPLNFFLPDDRHEGKNWYDNDYLLEGEIPGWHGLGILIKSLELLKIETFFDIEGPDLKFKPDITGKEVSFEYSERKYTADVEGEVQEKSSDEWRIIKITEPSKIPVKTPTPAGPPTQDQATPDTPVSQVPTPQAPAAPASIPAPEKLSLSEEMISEWTTALTEILTEPMRLGGILKSLKAKVPDSNKRTNMTKVKATVLTQLVDDGFIEYEEDSKEYTLV